MKDVRQLADPLALAAINLLRALRVVALSNEERMFLFVRRPPEFNPEAEWFLEHIDDLAPELHRRGWVDYTPHTQHPGEIVVTTGNGDICALVITELGRKQLNAAVGA